MLTAVAGQVSSTPKDGDATNSLSNLFWCLSALAVKKSFFPMQKWNFLHFNSCEDLFFLMFSTVACKSLRCEEAFLSIISNKIVLSFVTTICVMFTTCN